MNAEMFNKAPIWLPDEKSGKLMKEFMKNVEHKYNVKFSDYWDFHKWTTENIAEFWAEVWDFAGIIYSKPYDKVIDLNIPIEQSPEWFKGSLLNYAENHLKFRDDRTALIMIGENRDVEKISFKQMYEETRVYAAALRKLGLQKGDLFACYMSNRKEAVIAMLAATSIGAIWTGISPLLEVEGALRRLKQVTPKVLFTIDQVPYEKDTYYLLGNIKEIANGLPSLDKVIIIPSNPETKLKNISDIGNSCFLDDFLKTAYESDGTLPDLIFEQVSFSHPVCITHTSGTTGFPKMVVHGFGMLLGWIRDFRLHWNCQKDEIWLLWKDVGRGLWNIILHSLTSGSTTVLFEGFPCFLTPTYLWDVIDDLKVTRVYIESSVLDNLEVQNYTPTKKHDLSSLKMIVSAGSVVKPENCAFVLNKIKKDLSFSASYGTTETHFCMTTAEILPQFSGEISTPCVGVDVECLDDKGNPLVGEMGEYAFIKPTPSLPLKLWGDTNGKEFKKAYFSKFPGKFTVGDTIVINPVTKGIIVCGRSDAIINQKGFRFGSTEIYSVVALFPEIKDSLCVGHFNKEKCERAVLFVQMQKGHSFNEDLVQRLRKRITKDLDVMHVPEVILEAPGIPYNLSRKKTEIIVKKIINKMPHNTDTVMNPECLDFYSDIPELR